METSAAKRRRLAVAVRSKGRSSSRKRRLAKQEKKRTDDQRSSIDRITSLPDDILYYIFSFLLIGSIAQTSVLSRRLSCIWDSFPILDFFHASRSSKRRKVDFLSGALNRCRENSNITVFRFKGYLSSSCLHDCIDKVMKRNRVEELALHVSLRDDFVLPNCLFNCDSLRSLAQALQIHSNYNSRRFKLSPFSFGLPSLLTLSLIWVHFLDDGFVESLLSGCSLLPSLLDTVKESLISKFGFRTRKMYKLMEWK